MSRSWCCCGFLTFADPPKADVAQVLQALKNDGVQVKIVTGDNELVTRHVCEQVGIREQQDRTGE